jgi:predicted TPR repeat methyltransferase
VKPVDRARALSSPAEAVALYREWAQQYDHDVFATAGFTGSSRIADLLVEQMQRHGVAANTPILDLGCGTGAVGVCLHEHGCAVIDGLDISSEMLAIAASKQVYRNLSVADLTQPVAAGERYRACVSAGTFTSGHVGPSSVEHLAALLVDDAVVAWVVATTVWPSFEEAFEGAGLTLLGREVEPIRRGGAPEAVMALAIKRG